MPARRRVPPGLWAVAAAGLMAGCGGGPRLALAPLPQQDDDRYDIPAPAFLVRDDYYDLVDYTVFKQVEQVADLPRDARMVAGKPKQALNVTPLDEVQDSTWFTNRMGYRKLTHAEVLQGANRPLGPDTANRLTIVAGKTQGVTPGFTIEDSRGDRFVIKPDPKSDPELATASDVISTRILWAAGYNVPEDYIAFIRPEQLVISPKATVKLELGKKRPMTASDLEVILDKAPREPDGSIRVLASRFLKGKPLGPIPFIGVRKDDPNDVIRHEHRRELRGYKVFCSWLNHNDCREINSLDMYVEDDGRHFVRHYFIDLNATLGSSSVGENLPSEGYVGQFDAGDMMRSFVALGLYDRPWLGIQYCGLRGIGRFEAEHFDPEQWKPNYPAPPFENTTARDGFWAAKIITRFDDDLLRAAVESAEFSDPAASNYMVRTLAERRDRIGKYWFARVNPLDEFEVVRGPSAAASPAAALRGDSPGKPGGAAGEPALRFTDLAVRCGDLPARNYRVQLRGPHGKDLGTLVAAATEIALAAPLRALGDPPASAPTADRLLRVSIRSALADGRSWTPAVHVTLYLQPAGSLRVAAIERDE